MGEGRGIKGRRENEGKERKNRRGRGGKEKQTDILKKTKDVYLLRKIFSLESHKSSEIP